MKKTRSNKRLRALELTAYHEAGHAVASFFLRRGNRKLTIEPDEKYKGQHIGVSFGRKFSPDVEITSRERNLIEAWVQVVYAGCAAEARKRGRHNWAGAKSDRQQAAEAASYLTGVDEELGAYLDWLWIKTKKFVAHPLHWAAVETLAAELMREKTLRGRRVREIIKKGIGEYMA